MYNSIAPKDINPRYYHYARVHHKNTDEMMHHDEKKYPGGKMIGFGLWISDKWSEWRKINGYTRDSILSDKDHENFDFWLAAQETEPN